LFPLLPVLPRLRPDRSPAGRDGLQARLLARPVLRACPTAQHDEVVAAVEPLGQPEHAPLGRVLGPQPLHLLGLLLGHVVLGLHERRLAQRGRHRGEAARSVRVGGGAEQLGQAGLASRVRLGQEFERRVVDRGRRGRWVEDYDIVEALWRQKGRVRRDLEGLFRTAGCGLGTRRCSRNGDCEEAERFEEWSGLHISRTMEGASGEPYISLVV
jgi:hypothetical protein